MTTNETIDSGFALAFAEDGSAEKRNVWGRLICSLLLFFGLGGCLWSVLGLSGSGANLPLLLLIGCVSCVLSCKLPGRWDFAYIVVILALAVLIVAAGSFVIEGGGIAMNQMYAALESYIGRSFPRFLVNDDSNQALCITLFLMIPTGLLAILCGRVAGVAGGWRYVLLPFCIIIWLLALVFEASLPIGCVLALTIAAISLPASRSATLRRTLPNRRAAAWILVLSAVLTSLASVPGLITIRSDGSEAVPLRLSATRKIHSVRYDGGDQTLPEGDFSRIPGFILGEDPALTVNTENSGKYYLRGFVGEVYTGDGWTSLSPGRRAESATMFKWLHERGFYAQNQYALLLNALGVDRQEHSMSITNDGISTAYLYSPYELADNRADAARIGDENLRASGLRGEYEYAITVSGGSISDDELLYAGLITALGLDDPRAVDYLTSETVYREFVYANYLDMADAPREAIERLLTEVEFPDGRISFSDAKMVANTYLATFGYTEKPESGTAGLDVLTYFLEESGVGNSAHFATAAALIFRYMGVPARYVEGYLVTPGSETDENGLVVLHSKDAYAWAEIYRDGIGFVPFEPEFPAIPPLQLLETTPLDSNEDEPPATPPELESMLWLIILLGIFLLLLIVFIILAIRRSLKRSLLKKLFGTENNAESVIRMTTYAIRLLSYAGISRKNGSLYMLCRELETKFGKELSEKYTEVILIQQAALFSGMPIADADRAVTGELLDDITSHMKRQSSIFGRFRLQWYDCVF